MKDAWIDAHRQAFALGELCEVLAVSVSGDRAWKRCPAADPDPVQSIHAEFKGAYGRPRMVRERRARCFPASKTRVERLLREQGIHGAPLALRRGHDRPQARTACGGEPARAGLRPERPEPGLERRSHRPVDRRRLARSGHGAGSVQSRSRGVGWSPKPRLTADIVTDALTMAWFLRQPAPGLIHRSDRVSQYASHVFQDKLTEYGMVCSMSRQGNGWDNAPAESWFDRFKHERVFGERFATREAMKVTAFEYIEVFDNRKRLHSTLGYTSPVQFLKDWIGTQRGENFLICE